MTPNLNVKSGIDAEPLKQVNFIYYVVARYTLTPITQISSSCSKLPRHFSKASSISSF